MFERRRSILALTAALAVATFAGGAVHAEGKVLKMHQYLVQTRPEAIATQEFADRVYEKSGGELEIKVFYGGALGLKDVDMLRTMKAGLVDLAFLYNEYYSRDDPELAALYVSGAIREPEDHLKVLPTIRKLAKDAYAEWGIHIVGGVVTQTYDTGLHCKEPVQNLQDLSGKKVRVWSAHQVDTFRRLGVAAQVIPQNDMYVALQTGVVDCAVYLSAIAKTVSLQEVTEYESFIYPLGSTPQMFGVSDKAWNSLTPEQRDVLTEAGDYIWEKTKTVAVDREREAAAREERRKLGITVLDPFPKEDREKIVQASRDAWADIVNEIGSEEASQNREKIIELIDEK